MKLLIFCLALFATTSIFAQKNAAIDSFENVIKRDISNKVIAGGTYLLYQKGKVLASNTIGEADIMTHTPLKRTAIFRMASMTKPLASLALLLLQQDGLINLNDRLDKYLPAFSRPEVLDRIDTINGAVILRTHPAKNAITLRNLLTHTSGFASSFYPKQQALYELTFKTASKHNLEHYADQLAKLPLDFELAIWSFHKYSSPCY